MRRFGLKLQRWWPALVCAFAAVFFARHSGWSLLSLFWGDRMPFASPEYPSESEYQFIMRIRGDNTSADERQRLIGELDALPVRGYYCYHRWLLINNVYPVDAWDEKGFHPERSHWSRDIQLLWATSYGKADIENGGFHQFFCNPTGTFAPEMRECLETMGFNEAASTVDKAMLVFGPIFPRSRLERERFLRAIPGSEREEWDPFYLLDEKFYAEFKGKPDPFKERADKWIRERCGITHLTD